MHIVCTTICVYMFSLNNMDVRVQRRCTGLVDKIAMYLQGKLYENTKRWSFSFNTYAALTRCEMHQAITVSNKVVTVV